MNRAQRRAAPKPMSQKEWDAGINAVHEAAGGALDVWYVTPGDVLGLLVGAAIGNTEAAALSRAALEIVGHVNASPAEKPALCGCCDNEIKHTAFLVIVAAPLGRPLAGSRAICSTLCVECQSDVGGNALRSLRRIWPETRHVTVTHPAGGCA
jgi:hypothetical protein